MHYLLFYDCVPDIMERRDAFRKENLTLAWESQVRGELILAGVLTDPVDSAILFFEADSPKVVEAFVEADPYVKNGLVTKWQVREWNTVVGDAAIESHPAAHLMGGTLVWQSNNSMNATGDTVGR